MNCVLVVTSATGMQPVFLTRSRLGADDTQVATGFSPAPMPEEVRSGEKSALGYKGNTLRKEGIFPSNDPTGYGMRNYTTRHRNTCQPPNFLLVHELLVCNPCQTQLLTTRGENVTTSGGVH